MIIVALAKTVVKGSVTIQGICRHFTVSASKTGIGNNTSEAKKVAIVASNTAATQAARNAINKILAANPAVLSDLEITSSISNNFTTKVIVFKPVGIDTIATSSDSVNYTLNPNVTIGTTQMFTVPTGITLTGIAGNNFINKGYFEVYGNFQIKAQTSAQTTPLSKALNIPIFTDYTNYGYHKVNRRARWTVAKNVTITNNSKILNKGTITNNGIINNATTSSNILNKGTITNNTAQYSYITNLGTITNDGIINNNASSSYFVNFAALANNKTGIINNIGKGSYIANEEGATVISKGTINNSKSETLINNNGGTFTNKGFINNDGPNSSTINASFGTFINNGVITNKGPKSSTCNANECIWSGNGKCKGNCCISDCSC
jgi:hypothetical protein